MRIIVRTAGSVLYVALVAVYGAFIALGLVFLLRGLSAAG